MIVPYTDDGCVVMVNQYRHAVRQRCWEFPAGSVHAGEEPFDAARRELLQETGLIAHSLELLHSLFTSNGTTNEIVLFILARCAEHSKPERDITEHDMEERTFTIEECIGMLDGGLIKCSSTAMAILSIYRRVTNKTLQIRG
jgi:8-oxo-dGTP pyrophosphatase MutT (NUDIX family)